MSERLFALLRDWLSHQPVVLASVLETRGATPRKGGSRMLIADGQRSGSVGGGLAEAQVIAAAHLLLSSHGSRSEVEIDLTGREGAAGICGGRMRIGLRRWAGHEDAELAASVAATLQMGQTVSLSAESIAGDESQVIEPDVRLLIIGAGHCGLALHDIARYLEFDIWVYDERCTELTNFTHAQTLGGDCRHLALALDTQRLLFAVCLNRDFHCDVAALRVLCERPPAFIGMMGSGKRIAQVLAALPEHAQALADLRAPVGIEIDAQTPHEIAISILAQLVEKRRALGR
ncbi:MAG: XdhC family protein [Pseudomarimonas sp.]